MREYLISAVAVCAVCTLVSSFSPKGKIGKGVNFVLSLVIVFVLISPLFSAFSDMDGVGEEFISQLGDAYSDSDVYGNGLETATEEAANVGISQALCEKFNIKNDCITVESGLRIVGQELIFERVEITLSGAGVFANVAGIKKYISDSLGVECEVYLIEK